MERMLLSLAVTVLACAAWLTPAPTGATPACTCPQERIACVSYCEGQGCAGRLFVCNTSNPCNSSCTCTHCTF
jgi:hypothetical protein